MTAASARHGLVACALLCATASGAHGSPADASLPAPAVGVWFVDEAAGRRQCERYRALPAKTEDPDAAWIALVGALVVTPRLVHAVAEYGEGNFYAVHSVEPARRNLWKVHSRFGADTMPSADDSESESLPATQRLELSRRQLRWTSWDAPATGRGSREEAPHVRCGGLPADMANADPQGP